MEVEASIDVLVRLRSMSRPVLVTGGAGFIGSHLVERLVAAGEPVVVLDDLSRGRRNWLPPGAEVHEADIRDAADLGRVVAETAPAVVVHLAAMHFIPAVDGAPGLAWDVNVNGTRSLLDALSGRPPKLLLFASTAAVYPDRRGPIDERCPPAPVDLYGRTKLEGERLVGEFALRTGSRCVTARIFNVIGRRETNSHVVPELVEQLRAGKTCVRLGNLESRRDYTDVRDVAAALHALLSSGYEPTGPVNVGSGLSVSVRELVRECGQVLGLRIDVALDPGRRRVHDRAELVADPGLLRKTTEWEPTIALRETLTDLLTDSDEA
jgi:UDP-glucose 4-epimerase